MALDNLVQVSDADFEDIVLKSSLPVVVDFYADWCPPCKMMAPGFAELSSDYAGKMLFAKYNVDDGVRGKEYGIRSIPTLVLFDSGKDVQRHTGGLVKPQLKQLIEGWLRREP